MSILPSLLACGCASLFFSSRFRRCGIRKIEAYGNCQHGQQVKKGHGTKHKSNYSKNAQQNYKYSDRKHALLRGSVFRIITRTTFYGKSELPLPYGQTSATSTTFELLASIDMLAYV
ncbi:MAG: hypothetical protein QXR85_00940 [Candidatus Micrarchaeaceae archaeon]